MIYLRGYTTFVDHKWKLPRSISLFTEEHLLEPQRMMYGSERLLNHFNYTTDRAVSTAYYFNYNCLWNSRNGCKVLALWPF